MINEVYMSGTGNDFICSSYERDLSQIEIISIAGDSLVSLVLALKANPNNKIFLPVTVPNNFSTTK